MGNKPVHLVACGMNQKKSGNWPPAKDLYTSRRFISTTLERAGQPWFILSTAHVLIEPDELKESYDRPLESFDRPSALAWAQQVRDKLIKLKPTLKRKSFFTIRANSDRSFPNPFQNYNRSTGRPFDRINFPWVNFHFSLRPSQHNKIFVQPMAKNVEPR